MDRILQNAFYAGISKDYTMALSWLCHCLVLSQRISLTWRANVQYLIICMAWWLQICTASTDYPTVTQYHCQTDSGGRAVVHTQLDKTVPSPCRSRLVHETKSHCV